MSPEDQQQARIDYFGQEAGPPIGGFAPPPPPPPPPAEPPRAPAATKPAGPTWAYVRSLNSFPGNHPYFDADRTAGITGYFLEAHDPYIDTGSQMCRAAGFDVGVWSDPHGADAVTWANDVAAVARRIGATSVAPDPELTGKGSPGSPGWQWNADAAAALRAALPGVTIIVTPTPDQDDFNYQAWVTSGSLVWVQLYGAKLTDLFNADEVINRVAANGVPRNLIGALIPAGAIALYVPELQKLGVSHWAIYTIDDVGATDRAIPFGGEPGAAPPAAPAENVPPSEPLPQDDADTDYNDGVYADEDDAEEIVALVALTDVEDFIAEDDDNADYDLGPGSSAGEGGDVSRE